jgi:hypothetical protein
MIPASCLSSQMGSDLILMNGKFKLETLWEEVVAAYFILS